MAKQIKYYSKWGLLIFLMCPFSCTKDIEIKLPSTPQLVLHSYMPVGESFSVIITRPSELNSTNEQQYVNNAWVLLYENGVFKDSLRFNAQQKKYTAPTDTVEYGKTYTIRAGADGYLTAEATATAPQPVPTVAFDHKKNARLSSAGEFLDDVSFSIQDRGDEKNYYIAALYPNNRFNGGLRCVYSIDPVIDRPQPDVLPINVNDCIRATDILFNDQSFNGSLKQITISAWPRELESVTDASGFVHKPYLKRYTISQDFYKYYKYIKSQDYELDLPYTNVPALDIGNVTNGYGLFTIFWVTTDSLP